MSRTRKPSLEAGGASAACTWRERPVRLAAEERRRLARWARAAAPREACGVLLGREDAPGGPIVRVARLPNRARGEERFALAPEHIVRLERAARRSGLRVLGVWHSHPRGDARPSRRDRREGGGWRHHLIVAVARGRVELRRFESSRGANGAPSG